MTYWNEGVSVGSLFLVPRDPVTVKNHTTDFPARQGKNRLSRKIRIRTRLRPIYWADGEHDS